MSQIFKKLPFTKQHEKYYSALYTYILTKFPDANRESYIDKYKRELRSIIQDNKNWSD